MTADLDEVVVELPELGIQVMNWTSYEINQHYLTPADGWRLTLGDPDGNTQKYLRLLRGGEKVTFRINGLVQMSGYLDTVESTAARGGGSVLTLEGRDVFGPVVDGCVDPRREFLPEHTLAHVVETVLGDFGWTPDQIVVDATANRTLQAGSLRGVPTSKKKRKPLKSFTAFRGKPHVGEGAFEFLSRVCGRYGLWLWPSADGKTVIVSAPTFDQTPSYEIRVSGGKADTTNVTAAHATRNWGDQPSVIVATGRGDGNVYSRSNNTYYIVNELVAIDPGNVGGGIRPDILTALRRLPTAKQCFKSAEVVDPKHWMRSPRARVMYLHDDESATIDQLRFFLRRRLAEHQHKALTYRVETRGHTQGGSPWAVDTIATVDDDTNDIHENLWMISRTYSKSRGEGTRTHMEFIRPGTLDFAAPSDEGTASATEPATAAEAVGAAGSSTSRSLVRVRL